MSLSRRVSRFALVLTVSGLPVLAQAHELGRHTMSGAITSLNKGTGIMHVRTGMGTLIEHFPPKSESHLHVGERVQLHLGFTPLK